MKLFRIDASSALFLDFDGTLSPLHPDPDCVFLPAGGAERLLRASGKLGGALAIISGRDVRDLAVRIPQGLWRVGGHGADICPPGAAPPVEVGEPPAALVAAAEDISRSLEGVRLERKGAALALHYRSAPHAEEAVRDCVSQILSGHSAYRMQPGKLVVELRPAGTDKGQAIRELMDRAPFRDRMPLMVGDDATDEDAMAVCLALGGQAVKVGEGESLASYRLPGSDAVWAWLEECLG